jgi:membrane-associated phospholipid phosphatase
VLSYAKIILKKIALFVLSFFFSLSSFSQINEFKKTKDTSNVWQMLKQDTKLTAKGVAYSFTKPLHWQKKDFETLGTLLFGSASLSFADKPVRVFFKNNTNDFPKIIRDFGWYFGSPQNYFIVNAGLYGFGLFTKNEKIRRTSILIITSSITTGLIQTFSKNAIGRARPSSGNYLDFKPFANSSRYRSFPSGHTVLSITMAHSIAKQFKNTWTKIGIYTIGAIPPISRLVDDAHWLTDIAFSTVLSIIVVDSVDKFLFKENTFDIIKPNKNKVTWNFTFSGNQIGFVGRF